MSLATFRCPRPSFLDQFDAFAANVATRRRFLLTFKDGAHLVGVPTVRSVQDPTNLDATFDVITAVSSYGEIPFKLLAYAQQLVEPGLRASDGQAPVPEPCTGPILRTKHEKFRILDSPQLVLDDVLRSGGIFGVAVLYADVDHFKPLNTKYTERVIDQTVLPELQRLIAASVEHHGYAYAEGGDEMVIVLPNTSPRWRPPSPRSFAARSPASPSRSPMIARASRSRSASRRTPTIRPGFRAGQTLRRRRRSGSGAIEQSRRWTASRSARSGPKRQDKWADRSEIHAVSARCFRRWFG